MMAYIEIGVVILVMFLVGFAKYEYHRAENLQADNYALHGAVAANQKFITASGTASRANDARTNAHLTALETSHEADGIVAPVLAGTINRLRPQPAKNRRGILAARGIHL